MKKLFLFLLPFLFLFSCQNDQETGTILTGTADNLEDAWFILAGPGGARDTVRLDENQSFRYDFTGLEEPGNFYLILGEQVAPLYVQPEDQLDVYFDAGDLTASLNFGGEGANFNNYLADKNRDLGASGGFSRDAFTQPAEQFMLWADSVMEVQQAYLLEYPKDHPDHSFWKTEEAEIIYGRIAQYRMYPMYYQYFNGGEEAELPEGFDETGQELDVNRPEYLASSSFYSFVSGKVDAYAREKTAGQEDADMNLAKLEYAAEVIQDPKVLAHYLNETVTGRMQWSELSDIQAEIDFFVSHCQDDQILAEFQTELDSWKRLDRGQPAFEFEGRDLEGNLVKLSDFKGKYVYVDVWATWCGPCKFEIPHLKQLEADYHERNIVFISYSIDEDKQAWLDFVPENELGGVQIIGENAWQSELAKNYRIMGVPTFMFFDPQGNIISVKMTRPSDPETRERFDGYADL